MKSGLFLVLTLLSYCSFGQWLPSEFHLDTLRYSYRTGGELDSVDYSIGRTSGTQPGGSIDFPNNVPSVDFFTNYSGGNRQMRDIGRKRLIFSALPHVGFAYTFGTQGTQVARMNYQQIFTKKILVNFDFTNDRGNGFLRNSSFRHNDLALAVAKKGERWSFDFYGKDLISTSALSGGLTEEADPELFPLVFLNVQKNNASSNFRKTNLDLINYFDFQKDSIRSYGLTSHHNLKIQGRSYREEDTIFGMYDMINFDSLSTSDAYQLSRIDNGLGGFFRNQKLFVSARMDGAYWKYYNRGKDRDTLETNAYLNLKFNSGNWSLVNSSFFNVSGADNEWRSHFTFNASLKQTRITSYLRIENRWPDPFQRFYWANNYNYDITGSIEKQFKLSFQNHVRFKVKSVDLDFHHQSTYLKDHYFFSVDQGAWSNALIPSIMLHRFGLKGDLNYKILTVQPEYSYTYENGLNQLIPDHMLKFRTSIKGALFKSKKMVAFLGAEAIWFSSSRAVSFLPSMDSYLFNTNGTLNSGMFNLHAFGGFQIDEFRFFVRFENIGYLWTASSLELLENYPIPSSQLRVGLTWDFFN